MKTYMRLSKFAEKKNVSKRLLLSLAKRGKLMVYPMYENDIKHVEIEEAERQFESYVKEKQIVPLTHEEAMAIIRKNYVRKSRQTSAKAKINNGTL